MGRNNCILTFNCKNYRVVVIAPNIGDYMSTEAANAQAPEERPEDHLKWTADNFAQDFKRNFYHSNSPGYSSSILIGFAQEMNVELVIHARAYEKHFEDTPEYSLEENPVYSKRFARLKALIALLQAGLPQVLEITSDDEEFVDMACRYAGEIHTEIYAMKNFWV
jgi:hypothetical protein